jgi:hypothetical protein
VGSIAAVAGIAVGTASVGESGFCVDVSRLVGIQAATSTVKTKAMVVIKRVFIRRIASDILIY